ncbi:hypothetical protein C8R42DRAFT_724422 [Lentinula raphanica]|nr:hypothetical protein C8R42DRAFT_724422 [Lentinula raphanica]
MSGNLEAADTSREKIQEFIDKNHGVEACLENEQLLSKLIDFTGEPIIAITYYNSGDKSQDLQMAKKKLIQELDEDIEEVIKRNMTIFEQKMTMNLQILVDSFHTHAHQVKDADVKKLWDENSWKNNVKAQHFVLALQEFYKDQPTNQDSLPASTSIPSSLSLPAIVKKVVTVPEQDQWAISYLNVAQMQPILEAIDNDCTGFISIKEVNEFTSSKPVDWSLPKWIAYWAVGWHIDMIQYKRKIQVILSKMYQVLDSDTLQELPTDAPNLPCNFGRSLPSNRESLDMYLNNCSSHIALLSQSLQPFDSETEDVRLTEVIKYISDKEEQRLQKNLKAIAYHIDLPATAALVMGIDSNGHIERFILPLIYLILKRHLEVFYLCQTHILDKREFGDMETSLQNVFAILNERIASLTAIFQQTATDVSKYFSNFACGLLYLTYYDNNNPDEKSLHLPNEDEIAISAIDTMEIDNTPAEGSNKPEDILRYGTQDAWNLDIYTKSLALFQSKENSVTDLKHVLCGYWTGHLLPPSRPFLVPPVGNLLMGFGKSVDKSIMMTIV